jgi:hypothetical protein
MEMEKTAEATKESGDSSTLASCKSGEDSDDDSTSMDMDTCADEVADFADYSGTNQEEEGLHAEEVAYFTVLQSLFSALALNIFSIEMRKTVWYLLD